MGQDSNSCPPDSRTAHREGGQCETLVEPQLLFFWLRRLLVVVPHRSNAHRIAHDFVDQPVFFGNSAGPVAGEVVAQGLWLANAFVTVALDIFE